MKIIAHRGFWTDPIQKNSLESLEKGFAAFDGVETDFRDFNGSIVISHDPATKDSITADRLFRSDFGADKIWALNIKADGIGDDLKNALQNFNITNYFTFDMSIPEMFVYRNKKIKFYTSWSDLTPTPLLLNEAAGIWLDSFDRLWYGESDLKRIVDVGLPICFVSEDLHHRETEHQWKLIKKISLSTVSELFICTDKPVEARKYFCYED